MLLQLEKIEYVNNTKHSECQNKNTNLLEILELLVSWEPLLLSHSSVDGDGREVLLGQELGESHTTLHRLDEDNNLVELEHVQEFEEFPVLLGILQLNVVLL